MNLVSNGTLLYDSGSRKMLRRDVMALLRVLQVLLTDAKYRTPESRRKSLMTWIRFPDYVSKKVTWNSWIFFFASPAQWAGNSSSTYESGWVIAPDLLPFLWSLNWVRYSLQFKLRSQSLIEDISRGLRSPFNCGRFKLKAHKRRAMEVSKQKSWDVQHQSVAKFGLKFQVALQCSMPRLWRAIETQPWSWFLLSSSRQIYI